VSQRCSICGRGPARGHQVSHSNVHTKRSWYPNLQPAKVIINGRARRVLVCTRCLRSNRVQRAV
jgi:large subunit ribosomal protein L28